MDPDTEIQFDFTPRIRVYKSGRVERLKGTETVPASFEPATGVTSKDVAIHPDTGLSARLYLPDDPQPGEKLPVLVYFHGGAFCVQSAFSPIYQTFLNSLSSKARLLIVSVDYRLAPEHPLPAAYDDSWAALRWVGGAGRDPWLAEHADLDRVFLAGDSAGANITHHMAMRAGKEGLGFEVRIEGLVLNHPYFWGKEPVGTETTNPAVREFVERFWRFVCPGTTGVDDPWLNPIGEGAASLAELAAERVLVTVAGNDMLRERGRVYVERLKGSGWGGKVELLETEGTEHVFHLFDPSSDKALAMMERVVGFFMN